MEDGRKENKENEAGGGSYCHAWSQPRGEIEEEKEAEKEKESKVVRGGGARGEENEGGG